MTYAIRIPFTLLTLLTLAAAQAGAQLPQLQDRPLPMEPLRPWTAEELQRREALKLFALGVLCEREERMIEAVGHYEAAAKLDPQAPATLKALVTLYITVDRQEDALALVKKVLAADPDDFQTSYLGARLLRSRSQFKEAGDMLVRGLASPRLSERPDLHQQIEYDLGILFERQEKYHEAAGAFERSAALLDRPDEMLEAHVSPDELHLRSAEIHERAGRNFLEAHAFDQAASSFELAQSKYPAGAGQYHYYLAQIRVQRGQLAEALTTLDAYLQGLPQGLDGYELKIAVLQKLRREAEIVPWLEQATNQDRFNVGLRLLLGRQYAQSHQSAKAEKLFRDLAESAPSEELYRELFFLYVRQMPRGAEQCVELLDRTIAGAARKDSAAAASSAPSQAKAMIGAVRENAALSVELLKAGNRLLAMQSLDLETLQLFAALADRNGLTAEAESFYRACLKSPLPPAVEPLLYGGLLRMLWKAKRYEAIVEVCRYGLAHAKVSNMVLMRADLARALAASGNHDAALTEIDTALRAARETEKLPVRHLRVRLLLDADRAAQAETECLALLKEYTMPGEALEIHYLLSNVYGALKQAEKSEAELETCLKIDPENASVNNDLGYLWADRNKKLPEAEAMIRKAIDLDRKERQGMLALGPNADKEMHDNACYIDSLGWVLYRRGQLDAARRELERAAALPDSDDPVIWDHLGDVYQAQGEIDKAKQAWQQALDFYEHSKRHKMEERYRVLQEKLKAAVGKH